MKFRPVKHQHLSAPWQLAGGERQGLNVHRGLELRILHVEVRWCVIVEVHPDDEAVKDTDGGHACLKKIELIGRLVGRLPGLPMVRNDAFALFVGELQDVDLTARRQCIFHLFAQRIHLRLTGAKPQSARTRARLLSGLTLFSPLRWS